MKTKNKGFTLVEIMIVVVIIGLLASMAIPAFQKVRTNSQDKAVLNNARQLSAAIKALNSVANETYPAGFTQGNTITILSVAGSRTITYAP